MLVSVEDNHIDIWGNRCADVNGNKDIDERKETETDGNRSADAGSSMQLTTPNTRTL